MWAAVAVFLLAWLVGLLASMTFGGLLHILPVLAVILALWALYTRKKRRSARY